MTTTQTGRADSCEECHGDGWVIVPDHAPECWGDCEGNECPVPVQAECPMCGGQP